MTRTGLPAQTATETITDMSDTQIGQPGYATERRIRFDDEELRNWVLNPEAADTYHTDDYATFDEPRRTGCPEQTCRWGMRLPESTRPELWAYELPCPHSDAIWPDEHLIEHRTQMTELLGW